MAPEVDFAELVGLEPDPRLLGQDADKLPASVGLPEPLPPDSPARRRVVGVGAAMTGITLLAGIALVAVGIGEAVSDAAVLAIVAIVVGIVLVGTHWGWVHVAELTGQQIERRANRHVIDRRGAWLAAVEPYPRLEVEASTGEDGSIAIVTTRFRPVPSGERAFTFTKEEVAREVHSGDEPAAAVTERAELLRRQAALETARERTRYEAAHDAYERARLDHADEQERLAAVRAASEALSERINSNLRDPPLVE